MYHQKLINDAEYATPFVYVDATGELHIPNQDMEVWNKIKNKGYKIGTPILNGGISGSMSPQPK